MDCKLKSILMQTVLWVVDSSLLEDNRVEWKSLEVALKQETMNLKQF